MILIDNRNVLRWKDRDLLNKLMEIEKKNPTGNVIVERAKNGVLTMKVMLNDKTQYLHSKYDPEKDAERLINKFENEVAKHVLFVGTGFGYHIKMFMETHPNIKFSIYEPNIEVLLTYLGNQELSELPLHQLSRIFTGTKINEIENELQKILQSSNGDLQIITLPVYEKMYGEQIQCFMKLIIETLKNKRSNLAVKLTFQKRWTINSIKNFPTVLTTPNILHDIDKSSFENKPAIIVAAGPSLNSEFENLRYIKENKLAYIFSVGSAINALIEHNIYPDATCSFDPSEGQWKVIQKVKNNNIIEIPFIFGTSIGFETLEGYPGKTFHMITNQDTVSPQLLDTSQSIDIVLDSPSIAVVAFQLLSQLKCNPIILVGQNLGYRANKRYASGIQYDFVENELNEKEKNESITIKDVYGHDIETNEGFNRMRQQLEMYIGINRDIEVINTTKGGVEINGTSFIHLEELIRDRLKSKNVDNGWTEQSSAYDMKFTKKKLQLLTRIESNCRKQIQSSMDELQKIQVAMQNEKSERMENYFVTFDKQFSKLKRNAFYIGFIEPMVKVQNELLSEESQFIRYEPDVLKKAAIVVQAFSSFLQEIHLHHEFVMPYFEEMKSRIEEMTNEIEKG